MSKARFEDHSKVVSKKIKIMNNEIEINKVSFYSLPLSKNKIYDNSLELFSKNVKI